MNKLVNALNIAALGLGLWGGLATAVSASAQDAPKVVVVSYTDLNLTHADGVALLDRRLDGAVEKVCGKLEPRNLALNVEIRACRRETSQSMQAERNFAIARARGEWVEPIEVAGKADARTIAIAMVE